MSAGMMSIRTTNASRRTPTARAKPIGRIVALSENMNPPKTETITMAAAVTTDRAARTPRTTATRAGAPWTYASRIPDVRKSM